MLPSTSLDAAVDPHIRIDARTGKIYVQGAFEVGLADLGVAFSADHGQTWSQPFPVPSEHIAVHDGILAAATDTSFDPGGAEGLRVEEAAAVEAALRSLINDTAELLTPPTAHAVQPPADSATGAWRIV